MRITIFDDYFSYVHTVLGFIAYFIPAIVFVFLTYEIAEYELIHDHLIGDICEFSLGVTAALIITHIPIFVTFIFTH